MALRIIRNRFVALFDVLGFSDRIERHGETGLRDYISMVQSIAAEYQDLRLILFSDTIVAYTDSGNASSFESITSFSSELLYGLTVAKVPIRGAISYGPIALSEKTEHGNVVAGRPVIDAYRYESQQQWIGVMLTPSVHEQFPDLPERCNLKAVKPLHGTPDFLFYLINTLKIQKAIDIPVEAPKGTHSTIYGYAIVPTPSIKVDPPHQPEHPLIALRRTKEALQLLKRMAPDGRSQSKYQKTVEWLNVVEENLRKLLPKSFKKSA